MLESLRIWESLSVLRIFYDFFLSKNMDPFFGNGFSIYREKVWEFKQRCGLADLSLFCFVGHGFYS